MQAPKEPGEEPMRSRFIVCTGLVTCVLFMVQGAAAFADWNFREDFNGSFANTWTSQASDLPSKMYTNWGPNYGGAPAGSFVTLDGSSCYRMTNGLSDMTYVAWESQEVLAGSTGRAEARINTLTQDPHHLDGLFQMTLFSTTNSAYYVNLALWADRYSFYRAMYCTVGTPDASVSYLREAGSPTAFADNTWYRLTLDALPGQIVFSIWDDTGTQQLASLSTLNTAKPGSPVQLSDLGSSFKLAFGQSMGIPKMNNDGVSGHPYPGPYYNDGAVDWITAGAAPVPEPSSILALLTGLAGIGGTALKRNKPSR